MGSGRVGAVRLEGTVVRVIAGRSQARLGLAAMLVVNSLTSVWLLGSQMSAIAGGAARTDARLIAAYTWLDEHTAPREVVLASCVLGNEIPRYTHDTAFCGHHRAAVDFRLKRAMVERFFLPSTSASERHALLSRFGIRYVLVSRYDGGVSGDEPRPSAWLDRVFQNEVAAVY